MAEPSHEEALRLAWLHQKAGRLAEAERICRAVLAASPASLTDVRALDMLGALLAWTGRTSEAIEVLRQAVQACPTRAWGHTNLGNALASAGRFEEAITCYRAALALEPGHWETQANLAKALGAAGQVGEALANYAVAVRLKPDEARVYAGLGEVQTAAGRPAEAIGSFREALRLEPANREAQLGLALALRLSGHPDEAIGMLREALRDRPDDADAWGSLGNALMASGEIDEALACYRRVLQMQPEYAEAHSNLIYALHLHPAYDAAAIRRELDAWNARHAAPLQSGRRVHRNDRTPERRLRAGYVSPDLRQHVVGRFLLPLLAEHDRAAVEVYCYSDVRTGDAMTGRLREHADVWRDTARMGDAQLAEQIADDGIDILVDLALHTDGHRLCVFARKPAPVQVTWLGYAGSTGLTAIDYRLTDPYLDPPGADPSAYSEELLRLPETYWCYQPSAEAPAVGALPALKNGFITFGSLNNFCKVSDKVLDLWARVLDAVAGSRLMVHADAGSGRSRVLRRMGAYGIAPERCAFVGFVPLASYFQCYDGIDIALDPLPFGGGTTTCDALWMGVPVVTLAGRTAVGRGGCSILSNAGLPELVAATEDRYVEIAAGWAADVVRLAALRAGLRARLARSPLLDAPRFARHMEAAFREIWRRWCISGGKGGPAQSA